MERNLLALYIDKLASVELSHRHRAAVSMWIVFVWLWWFLWLIIWIDSLVFLMTRWRSITSNVRENISRFNEIAAAAADAKNTCHRCNEVLLPFNEQHQQPSTAQANHQSSSKETTASNEQTTTSIIEPVDDGVAIKTSIELHNSDGKISLHRVISYTGVTGGGGGDENASNNNEDLRILEICRTKNLVSKLTKKFEAAKTSSLSTSTSRAAAFKKSSEDFLRRSSSAAASSATRKIKSPISVRLPDATVTASDTDQDYFVIEKTEVYEVNDNKPNQSPFIITKRSHSFGEIRRNRKHEPAVDEPTLPSTRIPTGGSMENILEIDDSVQLRRPSTNGAAEPRSGRRSVRTVDDILQQERFSKCFSEYSISDLLNDLPDYDDNADDNNDDDIELTNFLNRIK